MKKLFLLALLFFCCNTPLSYAQETFGIRNDPIPEDFVFGDMRNWLTSYLTARFSVYDDLERQQYNWEKIGPVYKNSTPDVYWEFYEYEATPQYQLIEKDHFTRKVMINTIKKSTEPDTYEANITFIDTITQRPSESKDFRVLLRVCNDKICRIGLTPIKSTKPQF